MGKEYKEAIEKLYLDLDVLKKRESNIKKTINHLSELMNETPPFDSEDLRVETHSWGDNIKADQFFGKSLAGAVKEYLKMKGNAATAEEIYDALKNGGFEFSGSEKYQLRNLAISLGKNRRDFVYVKSSNAYGLWEFYPEKKKVKLNLKSLKDSENSQQTDENEVEEGDKGGGKVNK